VERKTAQQLLGKETGKKRGENTSGKGAAEANKYKKWLLKFGCGVSILPGWVAYFLWAEKPFGLGGKKKRE